MKMGHQYQDLVTTHLFLFTIRAQAVSDLNMALLLRQTNAREFVNPVTIPACSFNTCWKYKEPPPKICPLVNGPCTNNSEASDNGGSRCGMKQYTRDCYCNLKIGLSCAWSCTCESWWDTEDWFTKLCPDSPALRLDFSSLPKCARQCLDDASFAYGCLTQSSNCFCTHGDLFGCQNKCSSDEEWARIEDWLKDACSLDVPTARLALEQGYFSLTELGATAPSGEEAKKAVPPPPRPRKPLTWDEDFILAVLALTITVGLGLWVHSCMTGRRHRK